jgi:hypothetical protein
MQEKNSLGASPIMLNQSPEAIQSYIAEKSGKIYELYLDNVNPNFTEFEYSLLGEHTNRIIAKAIYQNNQLFIEGARTKEIRKKRKSELRKCLIKLLNCYKQIIHRWIGI